MLGNVSCTALRTAGIISSSSVRMLLVPTDRFACLLQNVEVLSSVELWDVCHGLSNWPTLSVKPEAPSANEAIAGFKFWETLATESVHCPFSHRRPREGHGRGE